MKLDDINLYPPEAELVIEGTEKEELCLDVMRITGVEPKGMVAAHRIRVSAAKLKVANESQFALSAVRDFSYETVDGSELAYGALAGNEPASFLVTGDREPQ